MNEIIFERILAGSIFYFCSHLNGCSLIASDCHARDSTDVFHMNSFFRPVFETQVYHKYNVYNDNRVIGSFICSK